MREFLIDFGSMVQFVRDLVGRCVQSVAVGGRWSLRGCRYVRCVCEVCLALGAWFGVYQCAVVVLFGGAQKWVCHMWMPWI